MVGPSSSHTAGESVLVYLQDISGEQTRNVKIIYGSFKETYKARWN